MDFSFQYTVYFLVTLFLLFVEIKALLSQNWLYGLLCYFIKFLWIKILILHIIVDFHSIIYNADYFNFIKWYFMFNNNIEIFYKNKNSLVINVVHVAVYGDALAFVRKARAIDRDQILARLKPTASPLSWKLAGWSWKENIYIFIETFIPVLKYLCPWKLPLQVNVFLNKIFVEKRLIEQTVLFVPELFSTSIFQNWRSLSYWKKKMNELISSLFTSFRNKFFFH